MARDLDVGVLFVLVFFFKFSILIEEAFSHDFLEYLHLRKEASGSKGGLWGPESFLAVNPSRQFSGLFESLSLLLS